MTLDGLTKTNRDALDRFISAWSTRDPDVVLSAVHPDFVYSASVGPEPGSTWRTRDELRQGLAAMFSYDQGAEIAIENIQIAGDVGSMEWRYRFARADGTKDLSVGCDLLGFRDGKLVRKDSYRKIMVDAIAPHDTPRTAAETPAPALQRYEPREFSCHGTWAVERLTLKVYGIALERGAIADETWAAARWHVNERSKEAEREGHHHGLGFVILHQGKEATWLLLNWWAHGDIRCQLLSAAKGGERNGTVFKPVTQPFASCVWEELVIKAERDAWVGTMLTANPARAAYLEAFLPEGPR